MEEQYWKPIELAKKIHQHEYIGYGEIGWFNMHWRDDKKSWCYTWNQEPCEPTHYHVAPLNLPNPPQYACGINLATTRAS